jgi:signal transduction histidine kinase
VPRPESPGGAGLGLTAVQRLLAAMNGRIELGRREGGGASVAVRLPIARPED